MRVLYLSSAFHAYIQYPTVKIEEEFHIKHFTYFFKDMIFYVRDKAWREHWSTTGYSVKIPDTQYKFIHHYVLPRKILKWTVPHIMYFLICRKIIKGEFDIIHAHGIYPSGLLARILSKKLGIPYIITEHGTEWYFNRPDEKEKKKIIKKMSDVVINAHTVIAVCERFADFLKSYWQNANIKTCHNSYNSDIFKPNKTHQESSAPTVINLIAVGTFNPIKNHMLLLKAINILKHTHPNIHLTIVGRGNLLDTYIKYIKDNKLDRLVTIKDFVPHDQLVNQYHNSHIFVSTSLKETFGIVLLEAMACGVPVVSSQTDGSSTIITDGDCGLIFENNVLEDLCQKIQLLIDNPAKRNELIKHGFGRAKEYAHKYREVYQIYKNAIDENQNKGEN